MQKRVFIFSLICMPGIVFSASAAGSVRRKRGAVRTVEKEIPLSYRLAEYIWINSVPCEVQGRDLVGRFNEFCLEFLADPNELFVSKAGLFEKPNGQTIFKADETVLTTEFTQARTFLAAFLTAIMQSQTISFNDVGPESKDAITTFIEFILVRGKKPRKKFYDLIDRLFDLEFKANGLEFYPRFLHKILFHLIASLPKKKRKQRIFNTVGPFIHKYSSAITGTLFPSNTNRMAFFIASLYATEEKGVKGDRLVRNFPLTDSIKNNVSFAELIDLGPEAGGVPFLQAMVAFCAHLTDEVFLTKYKPLINKAFMTLVFELTSTDEGDMHFVIETFIEKHSMRMQEKKKALFEFDEEDIVFFLAALYATEKKGLRKEVLHRDFPLIGRVKNNHSFDDLFKGRKLVINTYNAPFYYVYFRAIQLFFERAPDSFGTSKKYASARKEASDIAQRCLIPIASRASRSGPSSAKRARKK